VQRKKGGVEIERRGKRGYREQDPWEPTKVYVRERRERGSGCGPKKRG
jgi:hypothetical protein